MNIYIRNPTLSLKLNTTHALAAGSCSQSKMTLGCPTSRRCCEKWRFPTQSTYRTARPWLFLSALPRRTTYLLLMFRLLGCEVSVRAPLLRLLGCLSAIALLTAPLAASDVWSGASFSADSAALRQAAGAVRAGKHSPVTVLLNDIFFSFDAGGRAVQTNHLIYRIEDEEGVQNWPEISGEWEA